jgi:hypothetical protein
VTSIRSRYARLSAAIRRLFALLAIAGNRVAALGCS